MGVSGIFLSILSCFLIREIQEKIADVVLVDRLLARYGYLDSILQILGLISTNVSHQIDGLISVFNVVLCDDNTVHFFFAWGCAAS